MAPWWSRQGGYQMGKGKGYGKGYGMPFQAQGPAAAPFPMPQPQVAGVAEEWTTGTIRRLFVGKGFGFIARDDLPNTSGRGDVFLHFSDLDAGVTSADLAVGMKMKFRWEAARDLRGPGGRARCVSLGENPGLAAPNTTAAPRRAARTGRVYRKDLLLTVQQQMKTGCEYEDRRPFGTRSRIGPLPSKIVFPFTIWLPKWYWDSEDERTLAEANDVQRVQLMEARLDLENGADASNGETFGEGWALESWTYEDALAANQRLAWNEAHCQAQHAVPMGCGSGLAEFFQPVLQ